MTTNYERLTIQEDDMNTFAPTTSLLPLDIEEDDHPKRTGLLSRLPDIKRISRPAVYFLTLGLGTITMVFVLTLLLGNKTTGLRDMMTMDDAFDGSLSPHRHMIEWLPQCELSPFNFGPESHVTRGR